MTPAGQAARKLSQVLKSSACGEMGPERRVEVGDPPGAWEARHPFFPSPSWRNQHLRRSHEMLQGRRGRRGLGTRRFRVTKKATG